VTLEDPNSYFYKTNPLGLNNRSIYEQQRNKDKDVEIGGFETSGEDSIILEKTKTLNLANPGGFNQVWLKMKITAENSEMGKKAFEKFEKLTIDSKIDNPDITVHWKSGDEGTKTEIEKSSTVKELSSDLKKDYNNAKEGEENDFSSGTTTLFDVFKTLPELREQENLLIATYQTSEKISVKNSRMNFEKFERDKKNNPIQPSAIVTWDSSKSTFDINKISKNASKGTKKLSEYPFGSRVLELSLFDAKAGNAERDELIGVFYCFNTNGFTEDDSFLPSDEQDYMWFCSVGVPEWVPYEDQPEWMQCETKKSEYNDKTETAEVYDKVTKDNKGRPNANVCVFPRKNVNLKMRFRMVNLGDSRFNRGINNKEKRGTDYTLGVNKINFKGNDFSEKENLSTIKDQLAIVGRPQWHKDDEVSIEIKEMVVTQQGYSTELLEGNSSAGYREIASNETLKKVYFDSGKKNKSLYFRNQRLERNNRSANELHAAEYVEFFNGTAKAVNMDGWVLKIEQYKNNQLLGPRYPDRVYDELQKKHIPTYGCEPRADYILLANTSLPPSDGKQMPYGLVANNVFPYDALNSTEDPVILEKSSHDIMFFPLRFKGASDPIFGKFNPDYDNDEQNFSLNVFTAWNFLQGEETKMALFQTRNFPYTTLGSPSVYDEEVNPMGAKASKQLFNPLHFRDDADRIVLTLFAPKDSNKRFRANSPDVIQEGPSLYKDGTGELKFEEEISTEYKFKLVEEKEWLTSHPKNTGTMAGTYAIVDRAIINRNLLLSNPNNTKNDWHGGHAVYLNSFYTNPHSLRKSKPNAQEVTTISNYWSLHPEIYKANPGPLGNKGKDDLPSYLLKASGSPGYPDYDFTDGVDSKELDPLLKSLPALPIAQKNEEREESINDLYEFKHMGYGKNNHRIINYSFTSPQGAFIKDAPLASVAELCDIPAPSIEGGVPSIDPNPEDNNSLMNGFINGLESQEQYMTSSQKRMIFASASADATLLTPASHTFYNFLPNQPSPIAQGLYANPKIDTNKSPLVSYEDWTLTYTFYATPPTGYSQTIRPGRYKIFIEGLNDEADIKGEPQVWDLIHSIAFVSDGKLKDITSEKTDFNVLKRIGSAIVSGGTEEDTIKPIKQAKAEELIAQTETNTTSSDPDHGYGNKIRNRYKFRFFSPPSFFDQHPYLTPPPAEKKSVPLNAKNVIQVLPSNGEEYFNIQSHLEMNLFSDPNSVFLKSSDEYLENNGNLQQFFSKVVSSPSFQKIKIHLVPRENVGKVNINNAPLHILWRIPGFSKAVTPLTSEKPEFTELIQGAAKEVVEDIFGARHPPNTVSAKDSNFLHPYHFKDAGDLLVYENTSGDRKGKRIFPFEEDKDAKIDAKIIDAKCKIFREAFPHIQFAGNSFEVVTLGQALQATDATKKKFNVLASQKISVTIDLKELLRDLTKEYVKDVINIGKNEDFAVPDTDPIATLIKKILGNVDVQALNVNGKDTLQYYIYKNTNNDTKRAGPVIIKKIRGSGVTTATATEYLNDLPFNKV
jgi:hypothetical protein